MPQNKRALALKLAANGYELGLQSLQGILNRGKDGRLQVNDKDLVDWLSDLLGKEVLLVIGPLSNEDNLEIRTCRTCGRDFTDVECPHCRANRLRLRGH